MTPPEPLGMLRNARRALEEIAGYRLIDDLVWHEASRRWYLKCRLTARLGGERSPNDANWCVVVEDRDPGGFVSIYPAVDGGIDETFPHQLYNARPTGSLQWRTGKICTTTPDNFLGRFSQNAEPLSLEDRLIWHIRRALVWIELASTGKLASDGDPFELPDFPSSTQLRFVFSEDASSLATFRAAGRSRGLAQVRRLASSNGDTLFVERFQTARGKDIHQTSWGKIPTEWTASEPETAAWVLLDSVPLVGPWQVPATFGELSHAMSEQSLEFEELILPMPAEFRNGRSNLLLVGFPIPEKIGEESVQLHWQALSLPVLARRVHRGFRDNQIGWKVADRTTFSSGNSLEWVNSENWNPEYSHARGRFDEGLSRKKILLLGAGSLGSAVAEMLVRGGIYDLTVCDGDTLEWGNLARHNLALHNVGQNKAVGLAARLNSLSVHAQADSVPVHFPDLTTEQFDRVSRCDLIIDCTAEDSVLFAAENHRWVDGTFIVSLSFGWNVRKLFVVGAGCENFTGDGVIDLLSPVGDEDMAGDYPPGMVREAPGCWHPVFPGRCDDVWMMAASGMRELERFATESDRALRGCLYEWQRDETFEGIMRREIV